MPVRVARIPMKTAAEMKKSTRNREQDELSRRERRTRRAVIAMEFFAAEIRLAKRDYRDGLGTSCARGASLTPGIW